MKISIKLKPDEVRAIISVMEYAISNDNTGTTRNDAIIQVLILRIYTELKRKSIMMAKPRKMTLPVEQALAFCEYFETMPLDMASFNGHVIYKVLCRLDQMTAGLFSNE